MLMEKIVQIFLLLLAPGAANMAPPLAAKILPSWETPMDFGITWRGTRIFGSHKTFRGFISAILAGGMTFSVLIFFSKENLNIRLIGGVHPNELPFWFGYWIGLCVITADAAKSFFNRRLGLPPGASWIPFDQIDWALGVFLGSSLFLTLGIAEFFLLIALTFILSMSARFIGFLLRVNSQAL